MRMFQWILSALIILYLIVTPGWILSGLDQDPRGEVFQKESPSWYGIIELWHIVSFKPYCGSATAYLEERAKSYAKAHPGVHINVTGLTPDQFQDRLHRGLSPDAYSFASGSLYLERFSSMPIALPKLAPCAKPGLFAGELYALPYFVSGYALTVNTQILYQKGLDMPETVEQTFLERSIALPGQVSNLFAPEILAARCGLVGGLSTREDFLKGQVLTGLTDQYTVGAIRRSDQLNLLIEALPVTGYTDLIQYIGPARGVDGKRREIVSDFALFLLSDDSQKRLSAIGVMPASAEVSDVVYSEPLLESFYKTYQGAESPDPFLYERNLGALHDEALGALSGSVSGQNAFHERFSVVFGGKS